MVVQVNKICLIILCALSLNCGNSISGPRQASKVNHGCWFSDFVANCSFLNLSSVPQNLSHDLRSLILSNNSLKTLKNGSFFNYKKLGNLDVSHNLLLIIEKQTFERLPKLKKLILHHNDIKVFPICLIEKNSYLTRLDLAYNNLRKVPGSEFNTQRIANASDPAEKTCKWTHPISIILASNDITKLSRDDFVTLQNCSINIYTVSRNKLTVLPSIFRYLPPMKSFYMDHNNLSALDVESFMGTVKIEKLSITVCSIRSILPINTSMVGRENFPDINKLYLQYNDLSTIPDYALFGFGKLQVLDFQSNYIDSITEKSFCGLDSLDFLNLSVNKITSLPRDSFSCATKLRKINLSLNNILTLDPRWFNGCSLLRVLYFFESSIREVKKGPWNLTNLEILELTNNNLCSLEKYMFEGLPNLKALYVPHNYQLDRMSINTFDDNPSLELLIMKNLFKFTMNGCFRNMSRLVNLDLSFLRKPLVISPMHQFSHTSALRALNLSRTYLHAKDLSKQNVSLFSGLISLRTLELRHNSLGNLHTFPHVFSPLTNLHTLDLTDSRITRIDSDMFANLSLLQRLNLPGNDITSISEKAFRNLRSLRILLLQYNSIAMIEKQLFIGTPILQELFLHNNHISTIIPFTVMPSNLTRLDIATNPFACTCELAWFRAWLDKVDIDFRPKNKTLCSSSSLEGLEKETIWSFHPDYYCGTNIVLLVGVSLGIISALSFGIILYIKRWRLKYKFFLLKLAVIGYQEVIENQTPNDYEFQLNVMFHEEDGWWVEDHLKPFLEEEMPHLEHILFGDKDLPWGSFYLDAIYEVIENSYKTVLLLSNQSVDDTWFMTKLRMAVQHMNDTKLEKIILIFIEDIDDDHLPYLVRLLLSRNKPFLLWNEDEDAQKLCWAKFQKGMRENKVINNVLPV